MFLRDQHQTPLGIDPLATHLLDLHCCHIVPDGATLDLYVVLDGATLDYRVVLDGATLDVERHRSFKRVFMFLRIWVLVFLRMRLRFLPNKCQVFPAATLNVNHCGGVMVWMGIWEN